MFAGFEVRVGEAEEDFGEAGAGEEVGEEFHGVGAEGGDVGVGAGDGCGWRDVSCSGRGRLCLIRAGFFCFRCLRLGYGRYGGYGDVAGSKIRLLMSEGTNLVLNKLGD